MRVYLERDYSCDQKNSMFWLPYGVIADKKKIKNILIDKNKVPDCIYNIVNDGTAILFRYNLDKSVRVEAEVA